MSNSSFIQICPHPLLQHHLSILRDQTTNIEIFRASTKRITQLLLQEATRDLTLSTCEITTPLIKTNCHQLDPNISIVAVPILRAGLMMCDAFMDLIPTARIHHIGLRRDEETFLPTTYYNNLTINNPNTRVFILDPMLATGNSLATAIEIIKKCNIPETNITVTSIIASPTGIQHIAERYPTLKIFIGAIDQSLNQKAYIVPGLGDAGDRMYGTFQ